MFGGRDKGKEFGSSRIDLSEDAFVLKYPGSHELLSRESAALRELQSDPRVVRLVDSDSSNLSLKLERAPGIPLRELLKFDTLSLEDAREVVAQVAGTLHFMHDLASRRFVHYDISSNNIFWDPTEREVTVIDFGTCYDLDNIPDQFRRLVIGTPLYLSPEKLIPDPTQGQMSDVYALGVLWYEMVSGAVPFDPTMGQLYRQIKNDEPLLPRCLSRSEKDSGLILNMLRKNPNDRPRVEEVMSSLMVA